MVARNVARNVTRNYTWNDARSIAFISCQIPTWYFPEDTRDETHKKSANKLLTPFIKTFEDESAARLAYLHAHPEAPIIEKKFVRTMFNEKGAAILEEAHDNIMERFGNYDSLVMPEHAVWQTPNKDAFVAMYHLTAGPLACVAMPVGVYTIGGAVTAALALPVFEKRLDFGPLTRAGREITQHLVRAKWWRRAASCSTKLAKKRSLVEHIGSFLAYNKNELPGAVNRILEHNGIFIGGAEENEKDDAEPDDWAWWLDNGGIAPYARTDVDFYITADGLEEAQKKAEELNAELVQVIGENHVAVKTPNTLTICPPFPNRHAQIVLTVHRDLASVLLFADLDSTAAAWDGANVLSCGRFIRAVRTGTNLIPKGMWEERKDTVIRTAKYARRGFGAILFGGAERREEDVDLLRHAARFEPKYFTMDHVDDAQILLQLEENTAYNEFKIPRGPGVTPSVVERFLRHKGAGDRIVGNDRALRCEWRLSRCPEAWVSWGAVAAV